MGNVSAEDELVELLGFMVGQWIERHYILRRWRGYPSDLIGILHGCIRRYRFTGTFTGYLFKTLILAGRGLPPIRFFSLDKTILDGDRRIVENVVQDSETGEISMMKRIC